MEAPFQVFDKPTRKHPIEDFEWERIIKCHEYGVERGYAQLNPYSLGGKDTISDNGYFITEMAEKVLLYAYKLTVSYNFNDNDSMIDYFHTNFYIHIGVGKWNKPFKIV